MAELLINGKSFNLDFRFKNFIKYRNQFNSDFFKDIDYLYGKTIKFIKDLPREYQDKFINKQLQDISFDELIKIQNIQNENSFDLSDYVKISQILYVLIDTEKSYKEWFDLLDFLPNKDILISIYRLFQDSQKNTVEIKKN